nr:tetratricopeptide repeat protein [Clostridia bacterium]
MKKVVAKPESVSVYKRLADDKADGGDLLGALGLYLTVLNACANDYKAIADVADCYTDMGLLELSNRFWFKYLTVCPKDKQGVAYEELGINFFYLDNLWASGYYFHMKMEKDGFIAEEGLDEEIIKFFSSPEVRKEGYFIAYPYNAADYSGVAKNAKRALSAGDAAMASRQFKKIPAECRTEEISGDYATSLFLAGRDEEMIEVCKDSLARHGENVNAYCNLSSLYSARGDSDKAQYYYDQALKVRTADKSENYKIATCAIERGDHKTANSCIAEILKERPYDDMMNFFYAVSFINLGEYQSGVKAMATALKINPEDPFYAYFFPLFKDIENDNSKADLILPLPYAKALPVSENRAAKREIAKYLTGKKSYAADDKTRETLKLSLYSEDIKTAKGAAFIMCSAGQEKDREILFSSLLDGDISDEVKSSIVYLLVVSGEKRRIDVVIGNYLASIKPRKTVFDNKKDGEIYLSAYALAIAKSVAWGIDDTAKLAFNLNTLYTDYRELIRFNGFGAETISAIGYLMCEFDRFRKVKDVCAAFGVDKTKIAEVEEFLDYIKKAEKAKLKARAKSAYEKENKDD